MNSIKDFLDYNRDILNSLSEAKPVWNKYVIKFQSMFNEKPDSFEKVFRKFFELHQKNLEAPIFIENQANHNWLKFNTDEYSPKICKGVVMYLNPDSETLQNYCLPISELYILCVKFYHSHRNVKNVHYQIVPLVFLHKLFKCLVDVMPDNVKLRANLESAESVILDFNTEEPAEDVKENPINELFQSFAGIINGDISGAMNIMSAMNLPPEFLTMAAAAPAIFQNIQSRISSGENFEAVVSELPIIGDLMKNEDVQSMVSKGKDLFANPQFQSTLRTMESKVVDVIPKASLQLEAGDPTVQE